MGKLTGLKPERVFYYFEELTKIPRCSYNEKAVSDYLKSLGEKLGLETIQDESLNIIMKKPATKGYENSVGIVIQSHMDMVCEKEEGSNHNFTCDPLEIFVEGDLIKANKTTLGGDDGIGVAMGLALMEDNELEHPKMELVVTVEEEVKMTGAFNLSNKVLEGRKLINIDSDEEGILTMGSAGGEAIDIKLPLNFEEVENSTNYEVNISGLLGGHSGMEIGNGKGNAIRILSEVLEEIFKITEFKIVSISGGTKDNAIPRDAVGIISIATSSENKLLENLENIKKIVKENNKKIEGDLNISIEKVNKSSKAMSKKNTEDILHLLKNIHIGPFTMIPGNETIVESSSNLALVRTEEEIFSIRVSERSSSPKSMEKLRNTIIKVVEKTDAKLTTGDNYPAWEYKPVSQLRETAVKVYKELFNKDLVTTVIHAGLECGILNEKYPDMDIISVGPNMRFIHTPDEELSISSTERVYKFVRKLIEESK